MKKKMKLKPRKKGEKPLSSASSRYRFKPGHADDLKERAKKKYRKERGKEFELTGSVVIRALNFVDEEAMIIPVTNQLTAQTEQMPVLRLTHAAKLLDVSYQTLWRWSSETQQLPMPVLVDNTQGREYAVYHLEEVRVMLRTIGDHLTRFKYYRADHNTTRDKVFAGIEALRATNYESGDTTNANQEKRQSPRRKSKSKGGGSRRGRT